MQTFRETVKNCTFHTRHRLTPMEIMIGDAQIEDLVKQKMARWMAEMIIRQADFSRVEFGPNGGVEYRMDLCVLRPAEMIKAITEAAKDLRVQYDRYGALYGFEFKQEDSTYE